MRGSGVGLAALYNGYGKVEEVKGLWGSVLCNRHGVRGAIGLQVASACLLGWECVHMTLGGCGMQESVSSITD